MVRALDMSQEVRDNLNALRAEVNAILSGTHLLSAPGLAIGTSSAAAIKHAAFSCRIAGVSRYVAGAEVAFTATTHDIADPDANPREAIYLISVSPAGTVTITKGTTAAADAAVAPATPAGHLAIGEVKIQHNGSAIFDASTDDLSAAHLTDTYTDYAVFAPTSEDFTR